MAFFPNELRKCVAFVGYKDGSGKHHLVGSGFWICRNGPDDIREVYRPTYFATAEHVMVQAKNKAFDGKICLRLNAKSEDATWHETSWSSWAIHPTDKGVDIAILKIGIDSSFDHAAWPMESCVLNDNLDDGGTGDRKVELGDELCFAGLFHPYKGEKKNLPIIRIGNVSALRDEPFLDRDGILRDIYLVECRSIGGLSGSLFL